MEKVQLIKVGKEKEVLGFPSGPGYVALYTDTGLKGKFAIAIKLFFKSKPPNSVNIEFRILSESEEGRP